MKTLLCKLGPSSGAIIEVKRILASRDWKNASLKLRFCGLGWFIIENIFWNKKKQKSDYITVLCSKSLCFIKTKDNSLTNRALRIDVNLWNSNTTIFHYTFTQLPTPNTQIFLTWNFIHPFLSLQCYSCRSCIYKRFSFPNRNTAALQRKTIREFNHFHPHQLTMSPLHR